jgi:hypothetical protein
MAKKTTTVDPIVPVDVIEPSGVIPCAGTATAPCLPSACCGQFNLEESTGFSALLSYGGPFTLPPQTVDQDCDTFCGSVCGPQPLPGTYGILSDVICLGNLAPGTFQLYFRAELINQVAGQRIVAVFYPDCTNPDPNTGYVIADWSSLFEAGDPSDPSAVISSCGPTVISTDISVFSPNCNPGVQILFDPGCTNIIISPPPTATLRNIQFKALRLSSRDQINCTGSPLVPGVDGLTDFALASSCPVNGAVNVSRDICCGLTPDVFTLSFNKPVITTGMIGVPTNVSLFPASNPGAPLSLVGAQIGAGDFSFTITGPGVAPFLAASTTYVVTYSGVTSLCNGDPPLTGSFTFTTGNVAGCIN